MYFTECLRFNTQERDGEIAGVCNIMTAQFWEYDSRLGRRWNIDPEWEIQPEISCYSANSNNPVLKKDENGDIPGIGTIIGLVAGATKEIVGQTIANGIKNLSEGNSFFKDWNSNMDWADVVISAGEGAIAGTTLGSSLLLTSGISATLKGAVDYKGDGTYGYLGGNGKHEKKASVVFKESTSNFVGSLIGAGMGVEKLSKGLTRQAFKSVKNNFFRTAIRPVSGTMQGVFEGTWQYGVNELADKTYEIYTMFFPRVIVLDEMVIRQDGSFFRIHNNRNKR